MNEIFVWINDIPFKNTIVSGLIGAASTYFFTVFKIKKDRKVEFEKDIGKKIAESLYNVRKVIREANIHEIYDADNVIKEGANDVQLGNFPIYAAILSDKDSLLNFWGTINDVRMEEEMYLSYTSSAYLLYMSNYLTKLIQFLGQFEEVNYHLVGAILIFDIQKWQRSFDKQIVREINKNKLKLTSKTGMKWEFEKKKINNKYWNKSILKKLIEAESTGFEEKINEIAFLQN